MWRHTHAISRTATAAAATQTHHASVRGALDHLRTATLAVPSVAATPTARSLSSLACCVAISSSGSGRRWPCVAPVRAFGSSAKSSGSSSSDLLPIVTIEADAKLMREVTAEIRKETRAAAKEKRKTRTATAKTSKAAPTASTRTVASKRSAAATQSAAAASSSAAADAAAPAAGGEEEDAPVWEEWQAAKQPFASAAEEAEFADWTRILEEEERRVDAELEEEEEAAAADAGAEGRGGRRRRVELDEVDEDEDALEEEEDDTAAAVDEDEQFDEDEDEDDDYGVQADEADAEPDEPEAEFAPPPSAQPAAAAAKAKAARRASSPSSANSNPGVVSGGVRTRMLNVGGEQVMEISGLDADEDDEMGGEGEGGADQWEDGELGGVDLGANDPAAAEAHDPEAQVGRGVGGVFFSRKDIMELNESDLVEMFTKGSGKGGQKVNKTNSCVGLLHLPTGTRVKCQFSRDLQANRARARTIMRLRLEELLLGANSRTAIKAKKERRRKDRNRRRRAKKDAKDDEDDADLEEGEDDAGEQGKTPAATSRAAAPAAAAADAAKPRKSKAKKTKAAK